jgi:hypothetical protein
VSLVGNPTKIEENYILRAFQTKIHHGLIWGKFGSHVPKKEKKEKEKSSP